MPFGLLGIKADIFCQYYQGSSHVQEACQAFSVTTTPDQDDFCLIWLATCLQGRSFGLIMENYSAVGTQSNIQKWGI